MNNHIIQKTVPDSKVHGANMGPTWGRQDPGGPYVVPMNHAIRVSMQFIVACIHALLSDKLCMLQKPLGCQEAEQSINTENKELSLCSFGGRLWRRMLSSWQHPVLPVMTKYASWQLFVFSEVNTWSAKIVVWCGRHVWCDVTDEAVNAFTCP